MEGQETMVGAGVYVWRLGEYCLVVMINVTHVNRGVLYVICPYGMKTMLEAISTTSKLAYKYVSQQCVSVSGL